jgi:hypothetical protein
MNRIHTRGLILAAALVAGSVGMAQAQTARDGSTSPGGLVTESQGGLSAFSHRGYYAPYASGAYAYDGPPGAYAYESPYAYGDVYAADPGPYVAYPAPRYRRGWNRW